jgi:sterol desaturase/sphingolipid hydroxylase (fatty acid hydroxylase superfamily)
MISPVIISIPLFAILIALEFFLALRQEENYDRKDTWTNIALGLGSILFGSFFASILVFFYQFFYELAPYKIQMDTFGAWIALMLADDFFYYWFHRFSHEIRFLWNFHVVHHSSNYYNLSVAVRQSWFGNLVNWVFYIPIALMGFPLAAFTTIHGLNLVYQFWIHTKYIKKLPAWFELVFNTPSHHRVHHGVNDLYLDKNYGGILIIWDRIFGTFVEESEEPKYGILKPIHSYNLLWINTHAWFEMFEAMKKHKKLTSKLRCIFGAPAMDFDEITQLLY